MKNQLSYYYMNPLKKICFLGIKTESYLLRHIFKTLIFAAIVFMLYTNFVSAQNYNWITPNQTYLKMYVANDGIYRIDKNDFVNAGIPVTSIDPRTIKVYYKGNQTPIYFNGELDGVFNDTDYFDFYGTRNYGGPTNAYDINNNSVYTTDEFFNLYSDTSAYFIGWGGANGLRLTDYNNSSPNVYPNDYFYHKLHFEQDLVYYLGQNVSSNDYGFFSNDRYTGEGWYWKSMFTSNFFSQTINVKTLPVTPQQCRLKVFAYPVNQETSMLNEHRLALKVNSTQLDTIYRDNFNRIDTTVYFSSSLLAQGNNTVTYLYRPATGFAGNLNFDMFEVSYPRRFEFDSNYLYFNSDLADSSSKVFKVKGVVSTNPLSIYDVKNGNRIVNYSISNDTLFFVGKGNGEYKILNKNISQKPFRIKQRLVPNLVTSSAGADYLLVYNKLFETPAEQLRQYRNTHDGFRSVKAEIEDVYDIFNFGMEDPVAVRRFAKNVFDTWMTPRVKYLCLFGRGSLDPKKNFGASSVYYQNYVPVYGNPITDGYFANFNIGAFTYVHQISVGRLPAYTNQEAQDMVNKIISYESLRNTPENFWKDNLMITVGSDRGQQIQFTAQTNYFINSYISPPPISGDPHKVFKDDTTGHVTYNYKDSVINELNRGSLIVNYMGHAGSSTWEMSLDDPTQLTNTKFPLIFSMTCFTGKTGEPNVRGFGEKFMYPPNKGAIGFVGTTGWSFSGTGNTLNEYLLKAYSQDSLRRLGDITTKASLYLSPDSSNFATKNTNNCYNLIGDPALTLLLPRYPEFVIENSDHKLSNSNPSIRELVNLRIFPRNLGTYADSCKIRYQLLKNNVLNRVRDTVVYNWGFVDTVDYKFKIDSIGNYDMKVILDADNWYTQEISTNNTITIPILLRNSAFMPLKPKDNQIINNDSIEFVGLNPNINLSYNNVKLLLQIDTSKSFNSPLRLTFQKTGYTGMTSGFKVLIPIQDSSLVYFWRLNAIINNDTTDWSNVNRFKINPNGSKNLIINSDSLLRINLNRNYQFDNTYTNLSVGLNSSELYTYQGTLFARSLGSNAYEASYFRVNNSAIYIDQGGPLAGLSMWKIQKRTGRIEYFLNLRMNTANSSDSVLNFLNGFDTTSYLMGLNASYVPGGLGFNAATKTKMREFGSIYSDSILAFGWFDTWSFIGFLGATSGQVSEQYHPYNTYGWVQSVSQLSPTFMTQSGSITQTFGPAQTWQNFYWQQDLFPNSSLYFDVYGIKRNNQDTLLMQNVTSYNNVSLASINAYQYPYLKLITRLAIDSVSGYKSPVYKGVSLNYIGPPEIALDNNSIFKSDSIVSMGDSVGVGGVYYNVGYVPLNSHVRLFYALDGAGNKIQLRSDTINSQLKVDSSMFVKATFKVNGLPIYKKYNNQIAIVLEVNALNQNDIYDYNNAVVSSFYVKGSITDLNTEVYSDGIKLFGNDYVRSNPDMLIKLSGKSVDELLTSDTSVFRIKLNDQFISLNPGNSKSNSGINIVKDAVKGNLVLRFTPQLQNGINDLKLITYKNNSYDTANFVLNVTNETSLQDINNFPNPMKNETVFAFTLTGSQVPTECKIKIYSVAGRIIKEIIVPVSIGFNQVQWDGRDADGDYIANGVYFYRVVTRGVKDAISDIKKLVVLK